MVGQKREHAAREMLGRPRRKSQTAADLEDAQHFSQDDLRARREHMPELAQHDVEGSVRIRQRFGVAVGKVDADACEIGIVARTLDQDRRQIESGDVRTATRRRHRHDAGAAGHIEHFLAGRDLREGDELCGRNDGDHFDRHERRPGFALNRFEFAERVCGLGGHVSSFVCRLGLD